MIYVQSGECLKLKAEQLVASDGTPIPATPGYEVKNSVWHTEDVFGDFGFVSKDSPTTAVFEANVTGCSGYVCCEVMCENGLIFHGRTALIQVTAGAPKVVRIDIVE